MSDDRTSRTLLAREPAVSVAAQASAAIALIERASPEERWMLRDQLEASADWAWVTAVATGVSSVATGELEGAAWRELCAFAHRRLGAHESAASVSLEVARAELYVSPSTMRVDPRARAWETVGVCHALRENWVDALAAFDAALHLSTSAFYAQRAMYGVKALLASNQLERANKWIDEIERYLDDIGDPAVRSEVAVDRLSYKGLILDRLGDRSAGLHTQREAVFAAEAAASELSNVTRLRLAQQLVGTRADEALRELVQVQYACLSPQERAEASLVRASAAMQLGDLPMGVRACHEASLQLSEAPPAAWAADLRGWRRVVQTSNEILGVLDDPSCANACKVALDCLDALHASLNERGPTLYVEPRKRALAAALRELQQLLAARAANVTKTRNFIIDFGQRQLIRTATGTRTKLDERDYVLLQRLAMMPGRGWIDAKILEAYLADAGHKVADFKKSVIEAFRVRHALVGGELVVGDKGRKSRGYRLEE